MYEYKALVCISSLIKAGGRGGGEGCSWFNEEKKIKDYLAISVSSAEVLFTCRLDYEWKQTCK